MKFKKKCPNCGNEFGIFTILVALSPFSFKCLSCKTKLRIRGIFKLMLVNFLVTGLCAVFTLQYLVISKDILRAQEYGYLFIPAAIIIMMEVIRALLVCNKANLIFEEKKQNSEADDKEI